MQQAVPDRMALRGPQNADASLPSAVVRENPVVVVGRRGCCMADVIRRLLTVHGVNPAVFDVGDDADEVGLIKDLGGRGAHRVDSEKQQKEMVALPVVFIGGELVGGLETIMAVHISGELDTKLKEAGAIWL